MWYSVLITLVLDIGGLLLIYVLLRDRVRRAASANSHIAEIRDEVSRLLVELNQTTDRNIALMEDKIASLNELLSAADKKLGLIRRETEKHDVGTQVYSRLVEGRSRGTSAQAQTVAKMPQSRQEREGVAAGMPPGVAAGMPQSRQEREGVAAGMPQSRQEREGVAAGMPQSRQEREGVAAGMPQSRQEREGVAAETPQAPGAQSPLAVELSERPENRTGRAASTAQPRQKREGVAAGMPQPRQEREAVAADSADLQQRVMMLHKAGFAASLIAGRVGIPLGEVELIIALEQRKGQM
jgi:hypothetical protein